MFNLRDNFSNCCSFYYVAKCKSYNKAAEVYNISQPSLSRNVKELERTMNTVLFKRTKGGIELTKAGEELFESLDEALSILDNYSIKKDDKLLSGKLIIGTTRNIADNKLARYLTEYKRKYPTVEIKINTDSASNLNYYLQDRKIDVLIDYLPNINFTEKDNMQIEQIGFFNTNFACSKSFYDKYGKDIKTISDLNNYNLVVPGASRRRQMLNEVLISHNITLNCSIEMPDSKLMADFVKQNEYIGYFVDEEIKTYDLVPLKLDIECPKNYIGMIYYKNTSSLIASKFVELVLDSKEN